MTYPNPGETPAGFAQHVAADAAARAADYFVGFAARHATGRSR